MHFTTLLVLSVITIPCPCSSLVRSMCCFCCAICNATKRSFIHSYIFSIVVSVCSCAVLVFILNYKLFPLNPKQRSTQALHTLDPHRSYFYVEHLFTHFPPLREFVDLTRRVLLVESLIAGIHSDPSRATGGLYVYSVYLFIFE